MVLGDYIIVDTVAIKSNSELKATLEQKTIQLEKQKVGGFKIETMIIFQRKKMIMAL
jgi:hypothetical protein